MSPGEILALVMELAFVGILAGGLGGGVIAAIRAERRRRFPYTLGRGRRGRRYRKLPDVVAVVGETTGLKLTSRLLEPSRGFTPNLDTLEFEGQLSSGRAASLTFPAETTGQGLQAFVRFEVAADDAPELRVALADSFTRVDKWLGVPRNFESGDTSFDARYVLETAEPERARDALGRMPEVKAAIERLYGLAFAPSLALEPERVTLTAKVDAVAPEDYARVFLALDQLARGFDRVKLAVRVLGGERRAAVDASGKTRCPFCLGAIAGDEEALVACELCATVLHAGCWHEHGRCPLLGCRGREPERARTR